MARVEFFFPAKGQYRGASVEVQPQYTSDYLKNVRPYDVLENRMRGGQRPGVDKKFSQQIGSGPSPVVAIVEVTVIT